MQFALNYSPQAAQLLQEGHIQIDLFKCPDWEDLVAEAQALHPVYIHFPIGLGTGMIETLDPRPIEAWLARTDTRFVNTHLVANRSHLPADINPDDLVVHIAREVEILAGHFGSERVTVENIPITRRSGERGILPIAADPYVIRSVVEQTGCGLLLDLSHAELTCRQLGGDLTDYLDALPVHHLRELHVTGIGTHIRDNEPTDHLPMTDPDWARLEQAIDHIRSGRWAHPAVMAFEYGGIGPNFEWRSEADVIAAQVPRLYELAHSVGAPQQA